MNEAVVANLNALPRDAAREEFRRCCGATWWCDRMADARPLADSEAVYAAAEAAFDAMPRDAWLEAFACHPRLGDLDSLRMKYTGNRQWSAGEQAGAAAADDETLRRLAAANDAYFDRFGYLFILCATGKTAAEMLEAIETRMPNDPESEMPIAAAEQRKITRLRLAKLSETNPT